MGLDEFDSDWHQQQLENIDTQVARLATICDIPLVEPGIIERVIAGDASVCRRGSEKSFRELRAMLAMHYRLTAESIDDLGPEQVHGMLHQIRERLQHRFGAKETVPERRGS